ncbi:amidohydrolase family protein [Pelagibius marinus]|uniref:amidohydrolase family protein n=1 Tax=Pelagibius marinus TaxID=2762760 RepID=UPI0018725642|nr:amidohydrolase family protein [Pelagibius marinus]
MTSDYLPFHPNPKKPDFVVPPGAVDAHCHVFGPAAVFPFAPERKYTPVDAPKEKLFALRDHLGFTRNVIVQASCHGRDNRALADALIASRGLARGVAVLDPEIGDDDLAALDRAGVRAARFNFVKRLVDNTPKDVFRKVAERVTALGWHSVVYFEAADLDELMPFLAALPGTVVIDHMGRPDIDKGVEAPAFQQLIRFLDDNPNIWVKVSCPERLTVAGPPYDDVVPFGRALVARFPERVLWGTDWPHPNMKSHIPDDGALVDWIPRIAGTEALQRALLVDNPLRLYWPEEAGAAS